jgi:hypothetical protein
MHIIFIYCLSITVVAAESNNFNLSTNVLHHSAQQLVEFNDLTDVYYKDEINKEFKYIGSPWQVANYNFASDILKLPRVYTSFYRFDSDGQTKIGAIILNSVDQSDTHLLHRKFINNNVLPIYLEEIEKVKQFLQKK